MEILSFLDSHTWLPTVITIPITVVVTVWVAIWQIKRQLKNTLKSQRINKMDELHTENEALHNHVERLQEECSELRKKVTKMEADSDKLVHLKVRTLSDRDPTVRLFDFLTGTAVPSLVDGTENVERGPQSSKG